MRIDKLKIFYKLLIFGFYSLFAIITTNIIHFLIELDKSIIIKNYL